MSSISFYYGVCVVLRYPPVKAHQQIQSRLRCLEQAEKSLGDGSFQANQSLVSAELLLQTALNKTNQCANLVKNQTAVDVDEIIAFGTKISPATYQSLPGAPGICPFPDARDGMLPNCLKNTDDLLDRVNKADEEDVMDVDNITDPTGTANNVSGEIGTVAGEGDPTTATTTTGVAVADQPPEEDSQTQQPVQEAPKVQLTLATLDSESEYEDDSDSD
eukprot:TRINITY_DN67195_c4_g1_i2.p1 TRINITY_DN67195_c4_g1~~TRINITY_DN67195_c4_g1_i2.p1  ORF type:complete len:218 (+),score=42.53 TRINITY_DN67195_c4_g1_i2:197-850(+)